MTSLTVTKDNFISMIPKMYKFLDDVPEIKVIKSTKSESINDEKKYESLILQWLKDVENKNFTTKPW